MSDTIARQAAIDALARMMPRSYTLLELQKEAQASEAKEAGI